MPSIPAVTPQQATAAGWFVDTRWQLPMQLLLFVALTFTVVPDAFDYANVESTDKFAGAGYGLVARLQWFPLFALAAGILLLRVRLTLVLLREINPFLLLALVWIALSTFWSYRPEITSRRAVKIIGMFLVVVAFFVLGWQSGAFTRALRRSCFWLCGGSVVFVLLVPQYGVTQGVIEPNLTGDWRGLTNHKNSLGMLAVLSLSLWTHAWACREESLRRCLVPLAVALACLLGSQSTSALLAAMVVSAVTVLYARPPRFVASVAGPLFVVGGVVAALALLFIVTGVPTPLEAIDAVAGIFGKDATFTGRNVIWMAVLQEIARHPWLGCGFNGFWIVGEPLGPAADVLRTTGWAPLQAHNGYLDVLNELGIVGLSLLVAMLVWQFRQIAQVRRFDLGTATFAFAFLTYDLILNLTESNFLRPTFMPSLVEMGVVVACARAALQHKLVAASGQADESAAVDPGVSVAARTA